MLLLLTGKDNDEKSVGEEVGLRIVGNYAICTYRGM